MPDERSAADTQRPSQDWLRGDDRRLCLVRDLLNDAIRFGRHRCNAERPSLVAAVALAASTGRDQAE